LEQAVTALLGDVICEITREEVGSITCPIAIEDVETGYVPDFDKITMPDGTIDYAALIEDLIEDDKRFDLVMKRINSIPDGCPILVLANRVQYLTDMLAIYGKKGVCLSGAGQSKKAKQERKEALEKLNNGEIDCVFATYQLAAEGLDVPNLRYVVFATPEKNKTTVTQAAGRVGRSAEGKEFGVVIDFVDDFPMYREWKRMRERYYKEIGGKC
jgi:superfamily II DNA or RNA helicase